jgi:hypothetical protein
VVLTQTDKGWRFLEFTELSSQFTRDGQPLNLKSAPKKPATAVKPQG